MRYTAAFRLHEAIAAAVAVEWTDAAAPQDSNAGWEACVQLPNGDWRFADHDVAPAALANWRDPGVFANIGLRYRLTPSGPWSPASTSRKSITLVGTPPEEPPAEAPAVVTPPKLAGSGRSAWRSASMPGPGAAGRRRPPRCNGAATARISPGRPGRATRRWRRTTGPRSAAGSPRATSRAAPSATTAALPVTWAAPVAAGRSPTSNWP